jgi:hypothetical protein
VEDTASCRREGGPTGERTIAGMYRAHRLELDRLALLLPGDRTAAEDVVQDVFTALWRRKFLPVTNLCTEAAESRAAYYRSPVAAVVRDLVVPGQVPRSEIEELREQIRDLKAADKNLRRRRASRDRGARSFPRTARFPAHSR